MAAEVHVAEGKARALEEGPDEKGLDKKQRTKLIQFAIITAVSLVLFFVPAPETLGSAGQHTLAMLVFIIACWGTNCIPAGLASLVMLGFMLLFMTDDIPPDQLLAYWQQDTIWFIIMSFGYAVMMMKSGLGKRLSNYMFLTNNPWLTGLLIFFIMLAMSLLGMSSNTTKIAMVIPILIAGAAAAGIDKSCPQMRRNALLVCFSSMAVGGVIYSGGFPNTMLGSLGGFTVDFASYSFMFTLPMFVLNIAVVLAVVVAVRVPKDSPHIDLAQVKAQRKDAGKISVLEWKVVAFIAVSLVLWITTGATGFKTGFIAIAMISLACLPKVGVMSFDEFLKGINWPTMFMIFGIFAMSTFSSTGLVDWLWSFVPIEAIPHNPIVVLLFVSIVSMLLHMVFGAITGAMALAIPIFASLASSVGIAPECLTIVCYMALMAQCFFPYESVGISCGLAFDIFDARDVMKVGAVLFVAVPFVSCILLYPWYVFMGWV